LLTNLKTAIKHPTSIPDSWDLGKHLIQESIKHPEVKSHLKEFSLRVVKTDDVKKESGNLILHVLKDEELKALAGKMLIE